MSFTHISPMNYCILDSVNYHNIIINQIKLIQTKHELIRFIKDEIKVGLKYSL